MSENRNADIERIARLMGALSNPHRLRLFLSLAARCVPPAEIPAEDCTCTCACVGDLARDSAVSPSTVSHHLKELYNAGLIRMERHGQRVECSIDQTAFRDLLRFLQEQSCDPTEKNE